MTERKRECEPRSWSMNFGSGLWKRYLKRFACSSPPSRSLAGSFLPHVSLSHQLSPDLHLVIRQLVEWDDEPTCSEHEKRGSTEYFTEEGEKEALGGLGHTNYSFEDQCKQRLLVENRNGQIEMERAENTIWMTGQPIQWTQLCSWRARYKLFQMITHLKNKNLPFPLQKNNLRGIK